MTTTGQTNQSLDAADAVAGDGAVTARLDGLRGLIAKSPRRAADAVWEWFGELGARSKNDAAGANAELNTLFRSGQPPRGLDGPTDGMLVTTTINPLVDPAVRIVTKLWMPWQGKRFDAARASGVNRLTQTASLPSRLLWPLYSMKDASKGKLAFDFTTCVETGKEDPDRDVMVIDYSRVEGNPALIIRSIRDELIEIVPGAHLGKILFHLPSERYERIGFFALRS